MAVSPRTYHGYDSNNTPITRATANNATNYINPQEVAAAIQKVKTVAEEEIGRITTALGKLTEDANDAIIVQGTKMTGVFEEVITGIKTIPDQIEASIIELKSLAEKGHDQLQNEFNETARRNCSGPNVVTVK